jgi:hypothetical protein
MSHHHDAQAGTGQEESPPSWALPVTVAGDVVLVRTPGIAIAIGPICAYPTGFTFYLLAGFETRRPAVARLNFRARTPQEQAELTRLHIRYADGSVADSAARHQARPAPARSALRYCGGTDTVNNQVRRTQTLWWASPLPPAGAIEFSICLPGASEPTGTGRIEGSTIIAAAARCQRLWPEPGHS